MVGCYLCGSSVVSYRRPAYFRVGGLGVYMESSSGCLYGFVVDLWVLWYLALLPLTSSSFLFLRLISVLSVQHYLFYITCSILVALM